VNGVTVAETSDLQRAIGMARPGTRFDLEIWRDRAAHQLSLVSEAWVTSSASVDKTTAAPAARASGKLSRLGLSLAELNAQQLAQLKIKYGLLVRGVSEDGARAGLLPGDVIVGIGGEALASIRQLEAATQGGKTSLALQVARNGATLFVPLPLGETQ
jgi:serine protease Do